MRGRPDFIWVFFFFVVVCVVWSPFITVASLVLEFFPLFTAVEFPYRRIGYVTGTIYSILWSVCRVNTRNMFTHIWNETLLMRVQRTIKSTSNQLKLLLVANFMRSQTKVPFCVNGKQMLVSTCTYSASNLKSGFF